MKQICHGMSIKAAYFCLIELYFLQKVTLINDPFSGETNTSFPEIARK